MVQLKMRDWLTLFFVNISISVFAQNSGNKLSDESIIRKIECKHCIIPDSAAFFKKGYFHLKGKIGSSNVTIELNHFQNGMSAYLISDSFFAFNGFFAGYRNGIISFSNDEELFIPGKRKISRMFLAVNKDNSFMGYAIDDDQKKIYRCYFKEDYNGSVLKMHPINLSYENKYKNFPVILNEDIFFADTGTQTGKRINNLLKKEYDLIGKNYEDEIRNLKMPMIPNLARTKDYKEYSLNKFITVYKKVISKKFLKDAAESGHTDVFDNSIQSQILCNDGKYFVIKIVVNYADGDSYPYYDTFLFEYDIEDNHRISKSNLDGTISKDDDRIQKVVANLKKAECYDDSRSGDNWFLTYPEVAFILKDGLVLYKKGGNHGIHFFYKYYPFSVLKPIMK